MTSYSVAGKVSGIPTLYHDSMIPPPLPASTAPHTHTHIKSALIHLLTNNMHSFACTEMCGDPLLCFSAQSIVVRTIITNTGPVD